ncbi:MAG: DedA family protein [Thermoanaerobacter sp.]|nr:DedA family protein [Thermoanaerobacter sp.]
MDGYIIIFAALTIELIGAPTPGETLLTYCGYLVFKGQLNYFLTIITATIAVITGITVSYFIGILLNETVISKYGKYIHLTPKNLEKAHKWFDKYGNHLFIFAYFIPGVIHITGYFSGIIRLSFLKFAVHAYSGSLIWTATFVTLGRVLGYKKKKRREKKANSHLSYK